MSNNDDIKYTSTGERAAMGGYLAQYDAFAIGVYDAMLAGSLGWLPGGQEHADVNWKDADSIMGVASHWCGYLSYCSKIERTTLNVRAVELMKKYGDTGVGNEEKDKTIAHHYDHIGLWFPYKKAHAQAALDGMLEVASELKDGGAIPGRYQEGLFLSRDFTNIRIEAEPRPAFIPRIAKAEEWRVKDGWIDEAEKSERLTGELAQYNGAIVIGEYTHVKKVGDNPAMEDYEMALSLFDVIDEEAQDIFGESTFMTETEAYLNIGDDDPEMILLRGGYYTDFSNKSHWIAINPVLCFSLGWKPCEAGLFAWQDEHGRKMAESIYWQSGNINRWTRAHYEVGEGWLVLVTPEALEAMKERSTMYIHRKVMRRMGEKVDDMSHCAYSLELLR